MYVGALLLCVTGVCWAWVGVVVSHASRGNLDIGLIQLTGAALSIVISIAVLAFMRKLSVESVDVPGNLPSYWISPQNTVSSVYRSLFVALGTLASWFAVNTATGAIRRIKISSAGIKVTLLFAVSMLSVGLLNTYLFNYRGMDLLAQAGVGSIGMPIAVGVCVCGFFLYSLLFLRERLGKLQTFGLLAGVTGVVTICL
ncbi:MAG: hypothetical protein K9M45_08475 [Kiritimatiellales bacterium]|nr:hypothetical protein [Kiritimatiellales bacterium]